MKEATKENLKASFAGESQAHMKYLAFAAQAEKDGFANVARLFRAVSFAEQVHATSHLKTVGGVSSTKENLAAAVDGETFEVKKMYPRLHGCGQGRGGEGGRAQHELGAGSREDPPRNVRQREGRCGQGRGSPDR